MKKLFFSPLLCLAIFSCNSNLNNLNEESFYGSWSSHVQYNESISTDIAFSVDSITDLIFLQEMTLIQYEIDENDQRMPSTDFVDRSTSDRDIIKQKVEELLEANNNIVGSWSSDPDEIYGFRSESGQNKMVVHE
ncbi:MAG: hypothetical protein P8I92_00360, partial [Schleiferiaceae bacterium]|nr:hypothetical protein [Schleiferiaceae bacterium]